MRELNGAELAGFIKERQLKQVRNLRQEHRVVPRLLIVQSKSDNPVIDTYVRMKQRYADDVLIEVELVKLDETAMPAKIAAANIDSNVHGIIVQLPLKNDSQIDEILNSISSNKDVDGLGDDAEFPSATAEAIDWLLNGYNIDLSNKKIALLGRGRLVGAPLEALWRSAGHEVVVFDVDSGDVRESLRASDVIVTATGVPGRLTSDDVASGAVVVDAGVASEKGVIVGDAADDLRARHDISITPIRGGVGPLTIAVLFDHVIQAALKAAGKL
ncbi:MAG: bifunctional 5,10-methylenetetrahydrofolate dehydrogenase/5,10-methenyltetrahydrofolate cyclohydrolase [Candidatus Saccharibacteria bacterium]|nr:bifunctional 5,10-methylenetetrahydrofolate dehydrogenase/5,10-methenyltetrahydrofolate cyclohydrolase [Candidatus Saccharibacteria bacterium]MCA9339439.1 bifunctional 5,10-methylenetetrahydrofolate dehydrogenase/5,10-methenyltetrahydrofolate cyclohydrolase [Candidatus Saccharibacteria bacterium]HPQ82183.1 bifunctional 5,10-methylenetetrahydrofolate dehydrogenase/5,10-methenyltetrahydrofolate cyclohydrolase [Candidatus Saccharimonas sp.]